MTDFRGISLLLIVTSLICCCGCEESLLSVIRKPSQFDRKLFNNKKEILGMEENVLNLIEVSKTELRAELKENIRVQVREAMMEIMKGDALQDMVSIEVVSALRHFKRDYHRMRRRLHINNFSKSLEGLQDKMVVFHQPKKADVWTGSDSCVVCVRDKDRLEIELYTCNVTITNLKTDIDRLLAVNETCQSEISKLKQALGVPASPGSVQDVNTTSTPPVSASVTTPTPPQLSTSVTTVRPEEDKRRILIAPRWSSTNNQMKTQMHHFSKSLKGLQDKVEAFQQSRPQKADVWNGRVSCDVCVRDKHRLEIELYKRNVTITDLKTDIDRLLAVNETCQSEISQLKQSLGVPASPGSVQDVNTTSNSPVPTSVTTSRPLVSTTSVTTPRPPQLTTSVTTPRPKCADSVSDDTRTTSVDSVSDDAQTTYVDNFSDDTRPTQLTSVTTPRPPVLTALETIPGPPQLTTSVTTPGPPQLTSVTTPGPPVSTTSVTRPRPQVTKTSVMTPRPSVLTVSVTTLRPEEEKRKILIAPLWSETMHQFRQLNIRSKSLNVYPYHTLQGVRCLTYIAKTQTLLIGFGYPGKIMSSTLGASYTAVVREGVKAYGMAVDEERDIVFMTTEAPRRTISRMSTQGKDYSNITDLSKYGIWWPVGITLDNKRKKIYACKGEIMFILTYDGEGLATLARGTRMFAVFLDQTAGMLYYNNEKKLMKMAVSSNVSTEVTTLDAIPWSLRLYSGTIYYGSYNPREVNSGIIGAVDLTFNTIPYILKSIRMHKISGLLIQPIP